MQKILLRSFGYIGLFLLFAIPSIASAMPKTYVINNTYSTVLFRIKHLNVSYVFGSFREIKGSLIYDAKKPSNIKIDITIPANSVYTNNQKRDEHLRSPDFFNARQFPIIRFTSTKVTKNRLNRYNVKGNLTFHGVTKPISFSFNLTGIGKDPKGNERIGALANLSIKRSDFGVNFMLKALGDKIALTISLQGMLQK
jgi:polyisoprenoid-binding protein YceI